MEALIHQYEASIRLGIFLGAFGLLALWEIIAPLRMPGESKSRRWLNNISLVVISTIVLRVLFPTAAVGMAYLTAEHHWGILHHLQASLWLKMLIAFLLLDMFIYFQHMVFHVMPVMWRFHRVHHSDKDCDVTTGLRFHPVEIVVSMVFKFMLIVAIGPPVLAVILFELVLNFMSMFTHSNIHLNKHLERVIRWLFVTPDMHRVHHSVMENETNSNFGFHISIWDRIFGTYMSAPRDGLQGMAIGLDQFREPEWQHVGGLLRMPFASGIRGYAINYRDTHNAEELELARELARGNREKALLAAELQSYMEAVGQHALVSVTDVKGRILEVNDKFCEVSGYSREELIGRNHRIVKSCVHPDSIYEDMWKTISSGNTWQGELCNRASNGDLYWVDTAILPIKNENGVIDRYISVRLDITKRKQDEEELKTAYEHLAQANNQLARLSCIDGLTNISNRRHFDSTLTGEINKMRRVRSPLTLVLCDIDYFKDYNDTYGHHSGDECLRRVAEEIQAGFIRASDLVARYGGEEFAIILPDTDHQKALVLVENMRVNIEQLGLKHEASSVSEHVTISAGLTTVVPDEYTTAERLIEKADQALYHAKGQGRNRVQYL